MGIVPAPPPPPQAGRPRPEANTTSVGLSSEERKVLFAGLVIICIIIVVFSMLMAMATADEYWHVVCYEDGSKYFDELLFDDGGYRVIAHSGERVKLNYANCVQTLVDKPGLIGWGR